MTVGPSHPSPPPAAASPSPFWDGRHKDNETILIDSEQGIGDTIQFARYLPAFKKFSGANRLILRGQARTGGIFPHLQSHLSIDDVVEQLDVAGRNITEPYDATIHLLDLPILLWDQEKYRGPVYPPDWHPKEQVRGLRVARRGQPQR